MKKFILLILASLSALTLTSCSSTATEKLTPPLNVAETEEKSAVPAKEITIADYSDLFQGIQGSAVFYNPTSNLLTLYNENECKTQYSPYSTFKIPAALIGLEAKVLTSEESKMHYSGKKYFFDYWNKDLTLKEAFSLSCVWYFRQVIDNIGEEQMQKSLNELEYGNRDISQWEGSPINEQADTNGFWLDSSLKISSVEQIEVLDKIFEGKTNFSFESISILKNIMYTDDINNVSVYGKTGSGKDNTAWFVGFTEKNNEKTYFAIHLDDKTTDNIAGAKAKEIAYSIIDKYYSE